MSAEESSSSMENVLVKDEKESELPSSSRRFPVDSENPFQSPFYESDLVLIVEGKKLYVDKKTLSLNSPVFQAMFDGDFAEKDAEEIEIKDTKYDAMVKFLRQMYPVNSFEMDERGLVDILPLADFYQVDHFRLKCENYIGEQIEYPPPSLCPASKMLFLLMCDRFSLKHLNALLGVASKLCIEDIKCDHFESLQSSTKMNLLERRCRYTENVCKDKESRIKSVRLAFTDKWSPRPRTEMRRSDFEFSGPAAHLCTCGQCKMKLEKGYCLDCIKTTLNVSL